MFKFFFKKQKKIESLIQSYLIHLKMTQKRFGEALYTCMEKGACDHFDFLTEQTHKFESKADDIHEEINTLMYGKALIPESRGDIMGLLEAIDEIPGIFELVLFMIKTQRLAIPDFLVSDIRELVEVSLESCDLMIKQVEAMFKKGVDNKALIATIDHKESQCDHIERRIISRVFDSDLDPFEKLQLKEMIINMGEISDQADRVSKRVNIIMMKRRV